MYRMCSLLVCWDWSPICYFWKCVEYLCVRFKCSFLCIKLQNLLVRACVWVTTMRVSLCVWVCVAHALLFSSCSWFILYCHSPLRCCAVAGQSLNQCKSGHYLTYHAGQNCHWDFMLTSLRPRARASCTVLVYSNQIMFGISVVSRSRQSSDTRQDTTSGKNGVRK